MGSWWKPFIEMLPSYEDFQTHHPLAASRSVVDDFGDLCTFSNRDDTHCGVPVQDYLDIMSKDYETYKEHGGTLVMDDDKDDNESEDEKAMRWGFAVALSRWFGFDGEQTIVPLADNLNTGQAEDVNVDWTGHSGFPNIGEDE